MTDANPRQILPPGRRAGVCLHITSLPGSYGIGEIGRNARDFVDALNRMELAVWQFLPTGPTAYGDSPYLPLSTFAGNELLIDVAELVDRQFLTAAEADELTRLPSSHVDYGALIPVKNRLLRLAAGRFEERAGAGLKAACDAFVEAHDRTWLHDYALYRVLKSEHGERPWPEWQPAFMHRDRVALRKLEARRTDRIADIKVVQFLFHRQWQALRHYANEHGITLFGDLPIGIALDSADAWANPELLRIDRDGRPDAVAGVPPDYYSADGQLWGNPLYAWGAHRADEYRWWIERLRASVELADIVRIDHFRGFEACWSVPASSATARTGVWEPGPGDEIFNAMRNALGNLPIVAEDLGVITPEVEALRDRHQIPGMVVLQFDVASEGFDIDEVAENCVCYTGTHDNDTTPGWFRGSPNDMRTRADIRKTQRAALRITGGKPGTIHWDMIRLAYSTNARLAIAPLQDYLGLGSEARINTPGTSCNNWRWRVNAAELNDAFCGDISALVRAAGRTP